MRARGGHWRTLAGLLPGLARSGVDAMAVEVETGVERATQALWATAAQVHSSLKSDLHADALSAFDGADSGPATLNELRNLARDVRAAAALYLAEKGVDPAAAATLARAHREWDRRPVERAGFSNTPGDVLAFKHFRDAAECRREGAKEAALKKGVAVADTDAARARLAELSTEAIPRVETTVDAPPLTVTRLARTDTQIMPVGVVGAALGAATAGDVATAPTSATSGPFSAFGGGGSGERWVSLPAWAALARAGDPVAVPIPDCASVSAIIAALGADTPAAVAALKGPGLLIVDRKPRGGTAAPSPAVLVETMSGGPLEIVARRDGATAAVLYVLRPPKVDLLNDSDAAAPLEL